MFILLEKSHTAQPRVNVLLFCWLIQQTFLAKLRLRKSRGADCTFTRACMRLRLPLCVCVVVFGSVCLLFPEARLWKPTRRRRDAHDGTRWENRRPDEPIGLHRDIMFPMFWTAFTGSLPTQRGTLLFCSPLLSFFHSLSPIQTDVIENRHLWNCKLAFEMENKFVKTSGMDLQAAFSHFGRVLDGKRSVGRSDLLCDWPIYWPGW